MIISLIVLPFTARASQVFLTLLSNSFREPLDSCWRTANAVNQSLYWLKPQEGPELRAECTSRRKFLQSFLNVSWRALMTFRKITKISHLSSWCCRIENPRVRWNIERCEARNFVVAQRSRPFHGRSGNSSRRVDDGHHNMLASLQDRHDEALGSGMPDSINRLHASQQRCPKVTVWRGDVTQSKSLAVTLHKSLLRFVFLLRCCWVEGFSGNHLEFT